MRILTRKEFQDDMAKMWSEAVHAEYKAQIEAAVLAERDKVTKERDRMCEHCKWRNHENSTINEANQSKILGKS